MGKFVAFILVFVTVTCRQAEMVISPQMAVLGKWEEFQLGNGDDLRPIERPLGYQEYKSDSVLLTHEYSTAKNFYGKYYWKDSVLYRGSFGYKCQFYDDKMRLDLVTGNAIFYTSVYRRIQ